MDVAVELLGVDWGLLVLQLTYEVQQELVAVVLHGRVESFAYEVLQACGVERLVLMTVVLECLQVEFRKALRIAHRI